MVTRFDESFVRRLLSQDGIAAEESFAARRAETLRRLVRFERRERILKAASAVAVAVTFALLGLFLVDQLTELTEVAPVGLFGGGVERLLAVTTITWGLASMPLLVFLFLFQRRANAARVDARDITLLELREAIADLQRRVPAAGAVKQTSSNAGPPGG